MGIEVQGLRQAIEGLKGLEGRLRDARPWTQKAATKLRTAARTAIQTATEPDGTPHEPLAASTKKRKKGGSPGIESGRTLGSLDAYWDQRTALLRAPTPLAVWLNSGTFDMPARRFIPAQDGKLDEKLAAELVDDLIDYVRGDL